MRVGFALISWDLRFWVCPKHMGILQKRRDSFLPTYPLYNINKEKATQPLTTNLVLEFYKSSSLSFGLSVFLSFSLSLFLSFFLSVFLSFCLSVAAVWACGPYCRKIKQFFAITVPPQMIIKIQKEVAKGKAFG